MSSDEQPSERVIARLRPHARRLFWPSLLFVVICGAVGYFAGTFPEVWENVAVLIGGALLVLLIWLLPLFGLLARRYVITTRRIVVSHGLFVRVRQELLHSRGYDVTVRKAGLQAMFGSGDVIINTGLEHPVVLSDVPGADLVQSALHDLMEKNANPIAANRQAVASREPDETTAWGVR